MEVSKCHLVGWGGGRGAVKGRKRRGRGREGWRGRRGWGDFFPATKLVESGE